MPIMRHALALSILFPARLAIAGVLVVVDIAQAFVELAAADRRGSW
jgi:hypothetical protein